MRSSRNRITAKEILDSIKKRVYYDHLPSYEKDAAWLRETIIHSSGDIYLASGEADYQVYSRLLDVLDESSWNGVNIQVMAGPILSIPEDFFTEKKQKGREELSIVTKLAKDERIKLYPSEIRQALDYSIFEDIPVMNVKGPHTPGEKPSGSQYIYNSWIDAAPWIQRFREATEGKKPVTKNFQVHFLFLTGKEIAELKNWASGKNIDINRIDLYSCREFWRDYTRQSL